MNYFDGDLHDVAILSADGRAVTVALENDSPAGRGKTPLSVGGTPSSAPALNDRLIGQAGDLMPWGEGNDFPQRLIELYVKDPIIPQTLGRMAAMLVGRGVIPVEEDLGEKGEDIDRPVKDPEIRAFLNTADFKRYLRQASTDAVWFFNAWPELIFSKNKQKIVQVHSLSAEECRWPRMNATGDLPHVYLSADWPRARAEQAQKITALDPYRWDRVAWTRAHADFNIVYPINYPTPGKRYYSLAHHFSIVESGWLDVHLAVPAFKKFLMRNQMSIKYHWKVDKEYWGMAYGDKYTKGNADTKRAIKKAWLKSMSDTLTDVEKTGNSIMTETSWDPVNKLFKDHITLTTVTDAMKDGKYLDDNLEAAANIFYAIGIDPTIVGFAGGDKMGSRSGGSDKREAYLIALQMMAPFREMLLEPLDFIAEYNGWRDRYPNLRFRFKDTILTTLDTGAGTAKKLS